MLMQKFAELKSHLPVISFEAVLYSMIIGTVSTIVLTVIYLSSH